MFSRITLPIKFSIFSLLMTLSAVAVALSVAFYQSDMLLQEQALERLTDDLQREEAVVDSRLSTLMDDIGFISQYSATQGVVRASLVDGYDDQTNMTLEMWQARLVDLFKTVLRQRPAYSAIQLISIDNQGHEQVSVVRQGDVLSEAALQQPLSKEMKAHLGQVAQLAANEVYISDVTPKKVMGRTVYPPQSVLTVATPLYGDKGLFGVVMINVDFDRMLSDLYNAPRHIRYFLTNNNGQYLIHPDMERRMVFDHRLRGSVQNDYPPVNSLLLDDWRVLQQYFDSSRQGVVMLRYRFQPKAASREFEFWLGAEAELALLRVRSEELKQQLIILALFIVLGVTLGTLIIGRYVTRPILALKWAADRIGAGESDVVISIHGKDEVASLGQSMKTMLKHLSASRDELADLNHSLEEKVSQRTLELKNAKAAVESTNEELARALSEAEQAAVAKSQFLANMSHEIRTPLNGVLGMTELMLKTSLNDQQRGYLDTVRNSGNTLLNLLNDILDFSKLEAGKVNLSQVKFNPNEVVEQSLQLFVELADSKGLELIPVTLPRLPRLLEGDPDRLGQVLMNLVSNAIKFTEHGEVALGIKLCDEDRDSVLLRFFVKDTGIGIDSDQQRNLFEKFVQVDGSSTRRHGGTGLGLAICKQLVELMGGDIQLESTPGEGTLIWFDIRLQKGPTQLEESLSLELLSGKRVLVVDDNKTNRDLLYQMVNAWGMNCQHATDASTGLHLMEAANEGGQPYDLVLLDHMMPGKSGLEMAQEISGNSEFQQPRMILLTSITDQLSTDFLEEAGICSMMTKPLRQSQLYNHIVHSFEEKRVLPEPVEPLSQASLSGRQYRILLVEDTLLNQRVALGMLTVLGQTADLACDGLQAVKKICEGDYQLILMDVEMPVKDGLQATKEIRQYEQANGLKPVPVIALTAHALQGDREKCLAAGMSDYLTKPLTIDTLTHCLERWLPELKLPAVQKAGEPVSDDADSVVSAADGQDDEQSELLDQTVLNQLKRGLGADISDILSLFITEWPKLLSEMEQYLEKDERELLRIAAHRLKGACRNIGAERAAQLAFYLEQQALVADSQLLADRIQQLHLLDQPLIRAIELSMDGTEQIT